eukprot:scaffold437_cov159-Amphora_coffeaeformis.AAC.21
MIHRRVLLLSYRSDDEDENVSHHLAPKIRILRSSSLFMDPTSLIYIQLHCISFAFLVAYIATANQVDSSSDNMSTEEPPSKKAKSADDWSSHAMNIEECVMKADETKFLSEIAEGDLRILQGIGPKADKVLEAMGLKTIKDLAEYKFYHIAKSIKTLSETEGKRMPNSTMNLDNALDKEHETKSLKEILELPISALEGLTTKADETLKDLGVTTIADLAEFKYAAWAEAIVTLAPYEETKTKEERHKERALNKLK